MPGRSLKSNMLAQCRSMLRRARRISSSRCTSIQVPLTTWFPKARTIRRSPPPSMSSAPSACMRDRRRLTRRCAIMPLVHTMNRDHCRALPPSWAAPAVRCVRPRVGVHDRRSSRRCAAARRLRYRSWPKAFSRTWRPVMIDPARSVSSSSPIAGRTRRTRLATCAIATRSSPSARSSTRPFGVTRPTAEVPSPCRTWPKKSS